MNNNNNNTSDVVLKPSGKSALSWLTTAVPCQLSYRNVCQVTVNHIFLSFVLISHNPTVNLNEMNFKRLEYYVFLLENVT